MEGFGVCMTERSFECVLCQRHFTRVSADLILAEDLICDDCLAELRQLKEDELRKRITAQLSSKAPRPSQDFENEIIRIIQAGSRMERAKWLKKMRSNAEALYDRFSPRYWVSWGLTEDETHQQYLQEFLRRVAPGGAILSAACGAGRYDGALLEAGHPVLGIDQSAGVLARAKEHFPQAQYQKMALQEMTFREAFDGVICMDALEHICPEDYPGILRGFQESLKPGGLLYFTADREEEPDFDLEFYYERARAAGLPVVFGEVADEAAFEQAMTQDDVSDELTDRATYHYYPPLAKVRAWIEQAGLAIEAEGAGSGFHHFVARKLP